ncbi:MAG: alpha/beta hydrolase [Selenomonadaceae bacterium]|nr:alpha/beta hydrolase [Selenomonadaceae bacterium]
MYYESKILNVELKKAKIHYIPDVVYSQIMTFEKPVELLHMDILQPFSQKKTPAIIFITGGGFIAANRARMPQLRMFLAEHGYCVASINYRKAPNSIFPKPIEDVKSAIRFLKSHAENFNVDADQIALIGDSAGGYLTAMAATTNGDKIFNVGENLDQTSEIFAAVDLYGVSDLRKVSDDFDDKIKKLRARSGAVEALFLNGVPIFNGDGGSVFDNDKSANEANPLNYINKKSAPMLLMHGSADSLVSPSQSDLLYQALKNAGVEAERYIVPNAEHSDDYWIQDEVFELILDFLNNHLKKCS